MIAVNKWDLVEGEGEASMVEYRKQILARIQTKIAYCGTDLPVVFLSAKNQSNLKTLMDKVLVLEKRWSARIPTSKLNNWYSRNSFRGIERLRR